MSHQNAIEEIQELGEEYITNEEMKREFPAVLDAYRDIFEEVATLAGNEEVDVLAGWIKSQIKNNDLPPGMMSTASKAARLCQSAGEDVSQSEWFDEAVL